MESSKYWDTTHSLWANSNETAAHEHGFFIYGFFIISTVKRRGLKKAQAYSAELVTTFYVLSYILKTKQLLEGHQVLPRTTIPYMCCPAVGRIRKVSRVFQKRWFTFLEHKAETLLWDGVVHPVIHFRILVFFLHSAQTFKLVVRPGRYRQHSAP